VAVQGDVDEGVIHEEVYLAEPVSQRRARRANNALKQNFYNPAFCAISSPESIKTFYQRKQEEDKHHHKAVLALAHRRVNVLWAMLRDGQIYEKQTYSVA
jgi:hypothetical protein